MKPCFVHSAHNYGLPGRVTARVEAATKSDIESVKSTQVDCSLVLLVDFNFHPEDEAKATVDCPQLPGALSCPSGPLASKLHKLFDLRAETKFPSPTMFVLPTTP